MSLVFRQERMNNFMSNIMNIMMREGISILTRPKDEDTLRHAVYFRPLMESINSTRSYEHHNFHELLVEYFTENIKDSYISYPHDVIVKLSPKEIDFYTVFTLALLSRSLNFDLYVVVNPDNMNELFKNPYTVTEYNMYSTIKEVAKKIIEIQSEPNLNFMVSAVPVTRIAAFTYGNMDEQEKELLLNQYKKRKTNIVVDNLYSRMIGKQRMEEEILNETIYHHTGIDR